MANLKKPVALLLALTMALSVSGCGAFERRLLKGAKKLMSAESLHGDIELSLDFEICLPEASSGENMSLNIAADFQREPALGRMYLEKNLMGERSHSVLQLQPEKGRLQVYTSEEGEHWEEGLSFRPGKAPEFKNLDMLSAIGDFLDSFEDAGEEMLEGRKTVRYDGELNKADIDSVLELLGGEEKLIAALGLDEESEETLKEYMVREDFSLPMSIWMDREDFKILRLKTELTELGDKFMDSAQDYFVNEIIRFPALTEKLGYGIEITNAEIDIWLSQYNECPEIPGI